MLNNFTIYQMKGNQYPFGVFNAEQSQLDIKKVYVKKKVYLQADQEEQLLVKIQKIKNISYKNTINLRCTEEGQGFMNLYYQYVPLPLEQSFEQNPKQSLKQFHKQFIELAIFLAKNCIFTTFNPLRCGVLFHSNSSLLKYFLNLSEIVFTDDITILERSVNLFTVNSMHYLDTLIQQQNLNTTIENISQRTFKNRNKIFNQTTTTNKLRRDSQPIAPNFIAKERKLTNNTFQNSQNRKVSTLSRQLSEISQLYRKNLETTRLSSLKLHHLKQGISSTATHKQSILQKKSSHAFKLKRSLSMNLEMEKDRIECLISRSRMAIENFKMLKNKIINNQEIYQIIQQFHQ